MSTDIQVPGQHLACTEKDRLDKHEPDQIHEPRSCIRRESGPHDLYEVWRKDHRSQRTGRCNQGDCGQDGPRQTIKVIRVGRIPIGTPMPRTCEDWHQCRT